VRCKAIHFQHSRPCEAEWPQKARKGTKTKGFLPLSTRSIAEEKSFKTILSAKSCAFSGDFFVNFRSLLLQMAEMLLK